MAGSAPSTATVLEFRCLFTHDLRRKQKRWQDGRLKYHTFNSRVMVHDERGNSVGDMHWHGEYDFGEGEEVQLDRGGVIVQVEELVERRETDLTELVDKRLQEKQQRQIQQLARSTASSAVLPRSLHRPPAIAPDRAIPPRHRPLHHVIGTPTGHHGKALVPKESPYEQRQQATESPDDRAPKRRKYDDAPPSKSGYASALFGQTLTLSATPSSSISAIRRPRPEARSDPPDEADARDTLQDAKRARREQPQSSRRLNQSGYAQSLFGQTLTLSHTPVSSVPSRPQPRNEPASSPMVDLDRPDPRDAARTAPPQQPIESRHHGQPGSKSRPALLNTRSIKGNGLAKGGADSEISNQHDGVPPKSPARNAAHTIPDNIDIIEIDGPEPLPSLPPRRPMAHRAKSVSLPSHEDKMDMPDVIIGQDCTSRGDSVLSRRQQKSNPGRGEEPKKAKSHETTKKPETAASKANFGNSSSGRMGPAPHEKITRAPTVTKDPVLPVTELRIKSSKKRGLLMISDTSNAKKTRRKVAADATRSFEGSSKYHSRDSDDDDPFKSPSSRPASQFADGSDVGESGKDSTTVSRHTSRKGNDNGNYLDCPISNCEGELEDEGPTSELGKKSVQRTISTELGENDDPFGSPPPAVSEQTNARPEPATRNSDTLLRDGRPERVGTTPQNVSNAGLVAELHGRQELVDAVQRTRRSSSPPGARHDLYQIPSSPQASSPTNSSSAQRKGRGNGVDEILRPIDNNENLSKAKKQRQSRRKIVSDEDDADDIEPLAPIPKKTDSGSRPGPVAASRLAEEAPTKYPKSSKATRTKTAAQEDFYRVESDGERPKRAARKPRGQRQELGEGSDEDDQPIKRRQSTRQRRSRAASREEPSPLPSEQDGTEEEDIPRKRRKTKVSKASEDRPRLEKIKKNVKSRELVGFNLAALNAPLGPRGIGMPFSILPSPVNEPIRRPVSNHAAEDETESTVVVDGGNAQILPSGPKPPAPPFKMNTEAQRKCPTAMSSKQAAGRLTLAPSETDVNQRDSPGKDFSGVLDKVDGPESARLLKNHASKKPDATDTNPSGSFPANKEQILDHDASSKEKISRQQPASSESKLDAKKHRAVAPTPRNNATVVSSERSPPSLNQAVQDKSPTLDGQSSSGLNHTTYEDITPEIPKKTVASAQAPQVPPTAPATKSSIHAGASLQVRYQANDQQKTEAGQVINEKTKGSTEEAVAAEKIAADPRADAAPRPQAAMSLEHIPAGAPVSSSAVKKSTSALDQQSSTIVDQDTLAREETVEKPDSDTASDLPLRQSKAIGLRRLVSAPRRINNIAAKFAAQAETTEALPSDVHVKPVSNTRLANPASRGRKAALASDAAGKAPQRILPPTQPALVVPISTADLAMTPIDQGPKEPERPKKKMTFPGFQSARSDGPWSREAFDLLETGRPE